MFCAQPIFEVCFLWGIIVCSTIYSQYSSINNNNQILKYFGFMHYDHEESKGFERGKKVFLYIVLAYCIVVICKRKKICWKEFRTEGRDHIFPRHFHWNLKLFQREREMNHNQFSLHWNERKMTHILYWIFLPSIQNSNSWYACGWSTDRHTSKSWYNQKKLQRRELIKSMFKNMENDMVFYGVIILMIQMKERAHTHWYQAIVNNFHAPNRIINLKSIYSLMMKEYAVTSSIQFTLITVYDAISI